MGQTQSSYQKDLRDFRFDTEVELTINGKLYKVTGDLPSNTSLNTFIREYAHLKGTKFMCLEGGCGACIVSVQSIHPKTGKSRSYAVNSCLIPVFACHGWSVTTIEGLGSGASGYHNFQKRLAAASGSQCGYCSPGMVMNMNSLMEMNPKMKMAELENSFGGNICRCTGYRPILDAFKSFAEDAPSHLVNRLKDIEDLHFPEPSRLCDGSSCGNKCGSIVCLPKEPTNRVFLRFGNSQSWYRPINLKEIFELFDMIGDSSYQLVVGNTGQGVYRNSDSQQVYIDLNGIGELFATAVSSNGILLGGNVNLNEAMELFRKAAQDQPQNFAYCETLADHIDLIANVPVRNVGSIAGNLSLKHQHPEFPSDIFLTLETVGAQLTIGDCSGMTATMGLMEYMATNMNKKVITNIALRPLDSSSYVLKTYKVMPRAQNAHAHINAGFLCKVDKNKNYQVLEKPSIVFGGINPQFVPEHSVAETYRGHRILGLTKCCVPTSCGAHIRHTDQVHASKTEEFLSGKPLLDNETIKGALEILQSELNPNMVLPDPSPDYRKGLAMSLLYKFILSLNPNAVIERNKTGGSLLTRSVSSGRQDFDTDRSQWPVNQPVPKLEGLMQCAGEAEYTNDIPQYKEEVWAQLVLCDRALATIKNVDTSQAMKSPGFVAYFDAHDIPGKNQYYPAPGDKQDPVFAAGATDFAGQAVGVVIADTHANAIACAKMVKINYSKTGQPICDVSTVVEKQMKNRIKEFGKISPTKKKSDVKYKVKGQWVLKSQYHFTMETLSCVAVPKEGAMEIHLTSQFPASAQSAVSNALKIPLHRIEIIVRRLGGAYGIKCDRPNHTAVVCSLAAYLLHRPVRMVLSLETNMEWTGKRLPAHGEYEAGVSSSGEIQYLNASLYQDNGHVPNPFMARYSLLHADNGYDPSTFNLKIYGVITDNPWNTWCRSPGSTEFTSLMETVMEHIAKVVNKDPVSVRLVNLIKDTPLPGMINDLKTSSDFITRQKNIDDFNQSNRWKKRGINLSTMRFPFEFWAHYHASISIFSDDGSVAIAHGGIEMGQGINTKAAQVAARFLGVDMNMIAVKPVTTHENPNNSPTAGCQGSDCVSYAIMMCCKEINNRLAPIREKIGKKARWTDVIREAAAQSINLRSTYMFSPKDNVKPYSIYGVVLTEVEIDVLTGQYQVRRVDLLEDAGQSISPEVDIGQIEGAFMMGLGYYTSEDIVHNHETGALMSNRTWNYKPPGAKDIPEDFRVTLRKKAINPYGTLGSKATGEPALCLSCSVPLALRHAIDSARRDAGLNEIWFEMSPPYTVEKVWLACQNKPEMYTV